METEDKIVLPKKGIATNVIIENINEFMEQYNFNDSLQCKGRYEVLSNLEKNVRGKKIRHLLDYELSSYKDGGDVIFKLKGYEKSSNENGLEKYTVLYRFEGFVS